MNFKKLVLTALGLSVATQDADAVKPLNPAFAKHYTQLLNGFRQSVHATDMQHVTYDFAAQAKLDAVINSHNDSRWMFEVNPNPPFPFKQNMNGYFIGGELGMSVPFWGWHDTCTAYGQNCLIKNYYFRARQFKSCFNYTACNASAGSFNDFKSCETALEEHGSGYKCSYAWVYLGRMLRADVTRIACAVLEVPGWKPPPGQLNSYWCFSDGTPPSSDQPYSKLQLKAG